MVEPNAVELCVSKCIRGEGGAVDHAGYIQCIEICERPNSLGNPIGNSIILVVLAILLLLGLRQLIGMVKPCHKPRRKR